MKLVPAPSYYNWGHICSIWLVYYKAATGENMLKTYLKNMEPISIKQIPNWDMLVKYICNKPTAANPPPKDVDIALEREIAPKHLNFPDGEEIILIDK
ncbi:hypothetical protein DSO57_1037884 [Entomophthora muscae]|uniref:Uncharacterized protein n=1 Tax=Entomophthora muscae TaxID=34485 RepID=A0ACC2SBL3_9FUNG|nr:hypothetical protein DSO57_1037884 [Entomophthora muscae]